MSHKLLPPDKWAWDDTHCWLRPHWERPDERRPVHHPTEADLLGQWVYAHNISHRKGEPVLGRIDMASCTREATVDGERRRVPLPREHWQVHVHVEGGVWPDRHASAGGQAYHTADGPRRYRQEGVWTPLRDCTLIGPEPPMEGLRTIIADTANPLGGVL